jgi:hypothetical protein
MHNLIGNPDEEIFYQVRISFNNGLRNIPNVRGAKSVLLILSNWLKEPGTHWIRVYRDGAKLFEWVRG